MQFIRPILIFVQILNMIKENYSLKNYNTFNLNAKAKYFIEFTKEDEIYKFLQNWDIRKMPFLVLGGGSNILFTHDYEGIILFPAFKGIEIIVEDENVVEIKARAGENWDNFVAFCVENGYCGLENLSLIPGNTGAVPIQNIGAYGVEVKDYIEWVEAIDIKNAIPVNFTKSACKFGYRDSIFKNELKGNYIITGVVFKLPKKHELITTYGTVEQELNKFNKKDIKALRQAIINIRERKLPDYRKIGNAGSFFKNPVISESFFTGLKKEFEDIPFFVTENSDYKIPAAWLIEQCGWKGKNNGDAGVFQKQPLVLVNYGEATGKDIYHLSEQIKNSVFNKFGIDLEREVMVI